MTAANRPTPSDKIRTVADLSADLPQIGELTWIGVSTGHREPIKELPVAQVESGTGLVDDYHAQSGTSKRQVTLIQFEHLAAVASFVGRDITPDILRRNLVVRGLNLLALKDRKFRVGEVLMEWTGLCAPCSRMEEVLGAGGYNAMRGHGGITARVLAGGTLRVGDSVAVEPPSTVDPAS